MAKKLETMFAVHHIWLHSGYITRKQGVNAIYRVQVKVRQLASVTKNQDRSTGHV
jgi:hypothetical protein